MVMVNLGHFDKVAHIGLQFFFSNIRGSFEVDFHMENNAFNKTKLTIRMINMSSLPC